MKHFFFFFLIITGTSYSQKKINGVSFVASDRNITTSAIEPVIQLNANWVTLMPFAFMKTTTDTTILYNSKRQWIGERKEGIEKTAKSFKVRKIQVMLKPQIWIPKGGFTGKINMKSENEWVAFEKNYQDFILFYAKIAETTNCEIYCIGTELNSFVSSRPFFWKNLITKIKKVYSGKITYAENWDTYKQVPFISSLDYIGIDAYFPLSGEKTPTLKTIQKAWKPLKNEIKKLSEKYNRKILFTEYGYQSKDFTAQEPWEYSKDKLVNLKGQEIALKSIYTIFWKEDWFAGGFLWKWYDNHNEVGGTIDTDYTVQNKPSELIVKNQYAKK
ncbi:glycoside hydrolase family 113 [Flavobacterium sp.]|uniref:glycoside hydrolase family 113 n=1 Tax=Flavobacterium sp. TaxID=239 RepID=UPI00286E856A|nr:glycoside hydrolase [Flavobacterium sp.]